MMANKITRSRRIMMKSVFDGYADQSPLLSDCIGTEIDEMNMEENSECPTGHKEF